MPINLNHEDELRYQLALLRITGIGPRLYKQLIKYFGSAKAVLSNTQLLHQYGLKKELIDSMKQPGWKDVENDLAWLSHPKCHVIRLEDAAYPYLLKQISQPPPLLFVKGDLNLLQSPQLAIVGSRNPSPTGRELAEQFAGLLAQTGLTITSGLAIGIDGYSHRGALRVRGNTIAVLGSGLHKIYPQRHRRLAEEIVAHGALVSEFPLDYGAHPSHFPRRNRIISGLSLGTLVVEATLNSGSLITAKYAADQGREVFAIPSSIRNPLSKGCHALLQEGAKLVQTPDDVLEELNLTTLLNINTMPSLRANDYQILDEAHQKLLECIGFEATSTDQIAIRTGLSAAQVNSMLLIIELHGYIKSVSGGYVRVK